MLEGIDIAKVIVAFVITIFLILSLYYGVLKYGKGFISINQKGKIKLKEVKYIGKGKSLVLVEVNRKEFLLSVSDKEVKLIDKWDVQEGETPPDNAS